jgi:hypothetical protein
MKAETWFSYADTSSHAFSHLSYTKRSDGHEKDIVKVHRVLPSNRLVSASSRRIQFHWGRSGDSGAIVTPFMRVATYATRNFAHKVKIMNQVWISKAESFMIYWLRTIIENYALWWTLSSKKIYVSVLLITVYVSVLLITDELCRSMIIQSYGFLVCFFQEQN